MSRKKEITEADVVAWIEEKAAPYVVEFGKSFRVGLYNKYSIAGEILMDPFVVATSVNGTRVNGVGVTLEKAIKDMRKEIAALKKEDGK